MKEQEEALRDLLASPSGLSPQEEAAIEADIKSNRLAAVRILEEKHANKRLKFSKPFFSQIPTQAFGHIGNERFYFRYRSDIARLIIGRFDYSKEKEHFEEEKEFHQLRYERDKDSENKLVRAIARRPFSEVIPTGEEDDFYPTVVTQELVVHNALGTPYNGSLTTCEEIVSVFDALLEQLK